VLGHPLGEMAGYLGIGADGIGRAVVGRAGRLRAVRIWAQLRVGAGAANLGLGLSLRLRPILRRGLRTRLRTILGARLGLGPALRTGLRSGLRMRSRRTRCGAGVLSPAGDGEGRQRHKQGQARSLRGAERDARLGLWSLHGDSVSLLFLLPVRSGRKSLRADWLSVRLPGDFACWAR
jgi:hypothetical protein